MPDPTDWTDIVRRCYEEDRVFYSEHARREMRQEELGRIWEQEVDEAVINSEVIEEYPEDTPYPTALLLGRTSERRPIHLVCAYDEREDQVVIVTVYEPDPKRWDDTFRERLE